MAWAYTRYATDPAVKELEAGARTASRGLWVESAPLDLRRRTTSTGPLDAGTQA
jgi:endonuclease YncB( thermonuclease family)